MTQPRPLSGGLATPDEPGPDSRAAALIHTHARLSPVTGLVRPCGRAIRLWQADEITPLWSATETELERAGIEPPFWAFAWAGGQAVCRFILAEPERIIGRRVLDIACGSGMIAITAAACGASEVWANDTDPLCETAIRLNAEANDVSVRWISGNMLQSPPPDVDVILAGDVFYERHMAEAFTCWLKKAAASGVTVYAGDPGRAYRPDPGEPALAEHVIPTTVELEGVRQRRALVWRVLP